MGEATPREVKMVLLGAAGVGKSSIVLRFVTNTFEKYSESTIGASFMSKLVMVDGKPIKFQIWDTAGQEKYHSLAPMYYRGAAAAIVVFDLTRMSTFETMKKWVNELKSVGPDNILIAVCGNKADLDDRREVSRAEAADFADRINAIYYETSAKTAKNVSAVFEELSKRLPAVDAGGDPFKKDLADLTRPAPGKRSSGGDGRGAAGGAGGGGGGTGCC